MPTTTPLPDALAAETRPAWLYRSEAFAEDLLDDEEVNVPSPGASRP